MLKGLILHPFNEQFSLVCTVLNGNFDEKCAVVFLVVLDGGPGARDAGC